ncbi:hypothetical protein EGM97_20815 [Pseudomonas sp. AF32]|nr:hypothetical protein [Pseudomonas sp. AF32]
MKNLWERACSRTRRFSWHLCCLTHRFREQARSHSCFVLVAVSALSPIPLWERACSRWLPCGWPGLLVEYISIAAVTAT